MKGVQTDGGSSVSPKRTAIDTQRHAFIDESYSPPSQASPAYVMSAVIVHGDAVQLRREMRRLIAPADSFHTTELAHAGDLGLLHTVLDWIVAQQSVSLVVARMPYKVAEEARASCLGRLAVEVAKHHVTHVVIDSRRHPFGKDPGALDRRDARTLSALVSSGQLPRGFQARHYTDSGEPLLWLADAVAWIARRHVTGADTQWAPRMQHVAVHRV